MKKKVVSLLMAAAMTMTMLAGCGSTDAGATTSTTETKTETAATEDTAAATESTASGDVVTVRMMRNCFNVVPDSARTAEVQDAINAYIADKINVQIELQDISSNEYAEKGNLAIANNEVDLFWTASWLDTIGTKQLFAANACKDITDLLPGTALYDSMDSKQWEASKYAGKNYYIPVYKDNVEGYNVMLRKDLVDKYGVDVASIKTLKDLTPALEAFSAEGLPYTYLTQRTAMFYRYYIDSFDFFTGDSASSWVAVDRSKDEVVNTVLSDEYKEFATLMAEWAEAGYLSEDDATKTTNDNTIQGDKWGVSWWTDVPNNAEANGRYNREVVMAKVTKNYMHTDSCLGSCYAIAGTASDEAAKAAIEFMGLLYTDKKLADMYAYGIEGTDFNYDADGYVEKVADASYNHSMWESANATVVTAESSAPYTAQMYLDFNNGAEISCANGFQFDKTPVEGAYTACCDVMNEIGFALENGAFPVADVEAKIAEYEAALEEAGVNDVIAEFQSQYDAWKATK
ncbi:MAG: ABC transporter substrate-binding protein [Lachnospiraceae bacterium]|nr:ABC transporter substrate-binding protein [Lachnospiraceae bacterium]